MICLEQPKLIGLHLPYGNLMTIDRILSIIAITVSFIAVPASGYLSYRYALKGEKRKEWNAIAEPLLGHYEQVLREAERNQNYSTTAIPAENFEKIQRRMPSSVRKEFRDLTEAIIVLRNSPPSIQRNSELHRYTAKIIKILELK